MQVIGRRSIPPRTGCAISSRAWLSRYEFHDAGTAEARELLEAAGPRPGQLPVLIDGDVLHEEACPETLADAWQHLGPARHERYDLAIVGAGPAGLAAAVYAASDGLYDAWSSRATCRADRRRTPR